MPTHPGDAYKLDYIFSNLHSFDNALLMGLCSSAYICQRLTDGIMYIFHKQNFKG